MNAPVVFLGNLRRTIVRKSTKILGYTYNGLQYTRYLIDFEITTLKYVMPIWTFFQMVYPVGQHQPVPDVGRMRFLVKRTFLQGSKNTDRVLSAHISRYVHNYIIVYIVIQ